MEGWKLDLLNYAIGGGITLAGVLFKYAADKLVARYAKGKLAKVLTELEGHLIEAVTETGDAAAQAIKAASKDGKLTYDEAKEVRSKVISDTKKRAGDYLKEQVKKLGLDNLDEHIEKGIDRVLDERKTNEDRIPDLTVR